MLAASLQVCFQISVCTFQGSCLAATQAVYLASVWKLLPLPVHEGALSLCLAATRGTSSSLLDTRVLQCRLTNAHNRMLLFEDAQV